MESSNYEVTQQMLIVQETISNARAAHLQWHEDIIQSLVKCKQLLMKVKSDIQATMRGLLEVVRDREIKLLAEVDRIHQDQCYKHTDAMCELHKVVGVLQPGQADHARKHHYVKNMLESISADMGEEDVILTFSRDQEHLNDKVYRFGRLKMTRRSCDKKHNQNKKIGQAESREVISGGQHEPVNNQDQIEELEPADSLQNKEDQQTGVARAHKKKRPLFPGAPTPPPVSGYGLFTKEILLSRKDIPNSERMAFGAQQWKQADQAKYNQRCRELVQIYLQQEDVFMQTLSSKEVDRYIEERPPNKYRTVPQATKDLARTESSDSNGCAERSNKQKTPQTEGAVMGAGDYSPSDYSPDSVVIDENNNKSDDENFSAKDNKMKSRKNKRREISGSQKQKEKHLEVTRLTMTVIPDCTPAVILSDSVIERLSSLNSSSDEDLFDSPDVEPRMVLTRRPLRSHNISSEASVLSAIKTVPDSMSMQDNEELSYSSDLHLISFDSDVSTSNHGEGTTDKAKKLEELSLCYLG